jgi:hypothetical protein
MKQLILEKPNTTIAQRIGGACLASCQKLLARIQKTKDAIWAEFRATREVHDQVLRLALIEAEALAWDTGYPHLVFPTLAQEKAEAAATWTTRQHGIRQTHLALPLSA